MNSLLLILLTSLCTSLFAKPHFDSSLAWKSHFTSSELQAFASEKLIRKNIPDIDAFRVHIDYRKTSHTYRVQNLDLEKSGTKALLRRSTQKDKLGSFRAEIYELDSGTVLYHASVGTGTYYRLLSRAMNFRFPTWAGRKGFKMWAEHPKTGEMELVLEQVLDSADFKRVPNQDIEIRVLKSADRSDKKIVVTVYSEGYRANRKEAFFTDARKVPATFLKYKTPDFAQMEIRAAFYPSVEELGTSKDFSPKLPEKNTWLGLFYPYWTNFGRWYHVIYPTRELKFRRALGQTAYDYPIILADNSGYWGVGNYNSHTAIPGRTYYFAYLLIHEFGHFMGLNEEYEEPAPDITELSFAPEIYEPWSQNTTFLRDSVLKWRKWIDPATPVPTSKTYWDKTKKLGAYQGGYSSPPHLNHKPGFACVMSSGKNFCKVCEEALKAKFRFDNAAP